MMKRLFNILFLTLLFVGSVFDCYAKSRIISPGGKFDSRLLIVIDYASFDAVKTQVLEYKEVLEQEGLGVAILVGEWKTPDVLKHEIIKLYKRKPIIEGVVLIGDIPIVKISNFLHGTKVSKIDKDKFSIEDYSVTSDRFYDNLNLEFEFIKVDQNNPRHFYYKLTESSPQVIESDFYSARMLPPTGMTSLEIGVDSYFLLKRYLIKVINAHKEINYADNIKFVNVLNYNLDCLTAWQNEQFAIKEQFPEAFTSSRGNAFYNFREEPSLKFKLFERMQKEGTDLFVFNEHNHFGNIYINSESATHITDAPSQITPSELRNLKPQSKITILDASCNTSFDLPNYEAGYHVFGEGNTIVTQGNTILAQDNTLSISQDKWPMELIGMLAQGARIGFWQKEIQTLESHLIGDPTYSLTAGSAAKSRSFEAFALNKNLTFNSKENKIWRSYLMSGDPVYQAIALKQLSKKPPKGFDSQLIDFLKASPYYVVRMQALKCLINLSSKNLPQALSIALQDPYELIRRNAAIFAGFCGDSSLVAPLVREIIFSKESQRVLYAAQGSLEMFDFESVKFQILKQTQSSKLMHKERDASNLISYYLQKQEKNAHCLNVIKDKNIPVLDRIIAIRNLRDCNNHQQVEELLKVLEDNSTDTSVRVNLAEAFGWFRWSVKKDLIMQKLHRVYREKGIPKELKAEILQTILRLKSI